MNPTITLDFKSFKKPFDLALASDEFVKTNFIKKYNQNRCIKYIPVPYGLQ